MSTNTLTSIITPQLLIAIGGAVPTGKRIAQSIRATTLAEKLPPLLDRFEINRPLRLAHLLAQLAHESDAFCTFEEYASGAAYEGRIDLGNTKSGDGKRYKGRGPIQLTGRDNYRKFTGWVRQYIRDAPDFEAMPALVSLDEWAAWPVVYYWTTRKLNKLADDDDVVRVSIAINGGRNGLDDRKAKLVLAKEHIARAMAAASVGHDAYPTLSRGLRDSVDVEILQRALRAHGIQIAIDGDFGPATELAVKQFQSRRGIPPTGIADAATWSDLTGE